MPNDSSFHCETCYLGMELGNLEKYGKVINLAILHRCDVLFAICPTCGSIYKVFQKVTFYHFFHIHH